MMKNQHSVMDYGKLWGIAIAILVLTTTSTAKAQNNLPKIPNSTFNGLFSPNAAQRFFKTGREDFEREIKFVGNSERYFDGNLLKIDQELMKQIKENQSNQLPDLDLDSFRKQ